MLRSSFKTSYVLNWDITFFYRINQGQQNTFFDRVMPYVTEFDHWKYWLLGAWLIWFVLGGKKTRITLVLLVLLVGLLDYSNSFFFKHLFARTAALQCPAGGAYFLALSPILFFPFQSCRQCFRGGFFPILYLSPLGPRFDFHRPAGGVLPRLCGGAFSAGCGRRGGSGCHRGRGDALFPVSDPEMVASRGVFSGRNKPNDKRN